MFRGGGAFAAHSFGTSDPLGMGQGYLACSSFLLMVPRGFLGRGLYLCQIKMEIDKASGHDEVNAVTT